MVAHIVPQGAELPFPALVKGYLVGIGLILLLQYTGAVLRVIAASHLPVEMEYQEVEKNEHPIHKKGQPGRAVGKVKQKYDHGNGGRGNQKYGEPVEGAVRLKLFFGRGTTLFQHQGHKKQEQGGYQVSKLGGMGRH